MAYHRVVEPHFGPLTVVLAGVLLLAAGLSRLRTTWWRRSLSTPPYPEMAAAGADAWKASPAGLAPIARRHGGACG